MTRIHRNTHFKTVKSLMDHRSLQRFSVIPILFALTGCSTAAKVELLPDSVKAEMGAVAIAATVQPDAVKVWKPSAASAAREGAGKAVEIANLLTMGFWPIFFYGAGAIAVPSLGAAIGYLAGPANDPPSEEVGKVQSTLRGIVDDTRIAERIAQAMLENLGKTAHPVRFLNADSTDPRRFAVDGSANQRVKTVLEIEVTELMVAGPWGGDSEATISMTVATRVVSVTDRSLLFSHTSEFKDNYELHDWYEQQADRDNSRALRWILVRAAEFVGRDIAGRFHTEQHAAGSVRKTNLN